MPATVELFKKYPNPVFIETGSWHGDGIQQALDAGFKKVYSIELSNQLYEQCRNRFDKNKDVILFNGDSSDILPYLLFNIHVPVTFWLDGHYSCGDTAMGKLKSPLIQELSAIRGHDVRNHTILIDDLRDWTIEEHGFNTEILKQIISKINPGYKFTLEDGYIPNDILVAKL